MKQFVLIIILGIASSCTKSNRLPIKDEHGRRIFYSENDYLETTAKDNNFVIIDTSCINSKVQALKDIRINKLTYYYDRIGPHEKQFKAELKKYNISSRLGNMSSCIRTGRFQYNCYEEEMMTELNRRYGRKFFDSIWNKTLNNHMSKFPNDSIVEGGKKLMWKDVYKSLLK